LSERVLSALIRGAVEAFRAGWGSPLWHGFRLFAVDGTTVRLPDGAGLEAFFGAQVIGPILAGASILYEVDHDLVVDTQVSAMCVSERELAIEHLGAARPGDLLLYDRREGTAENPSNRSNGQTHESPPGGLPILIS
jgi:hypothetical protein